VKSPYLWMKERLAHQLEQLVRPESPAQGQDRMAEIERLLEESGAGTARGCRPGYLPGKPGHGGIGGGSAAPEPQPGGR
jgi:hypothetical protein